MKRLFLNGKIFTSNEEQLYAEAMLTEDGRITWIGSSEEAKELEVSLKIGAANGQRPCEVIDLPCEVIDLPCEVIDLQGRTVVPGFVDAHMHPMMLAEYSRQIACLPPKINSIRQLSQAIAQAAEDIRAEEEHRDAPAADLSAAANPPAADLPNAPAADAGDAGSIAPAADLPWICGWGYDEGKYEEKRSPNRYDLDLGCPDFPVFLVRSCEHIRCVNSKALEIAGITKDTPDPPGGSIDRDEQGAPTGILRENARDLVLPYMPVETEDELVSALTDLGDLLISQGIVAVADMGNLHAGGNFEYYAKAVEKGFRQRVALYYMWDYFMDDPDFAITPALMDREQQIRIAGLKLIGDGSISGKTAWLHEPYMGTEEQGMPVYTDESLEKAISFAKEAGCQISVHAMGGQAIDRIVDRICEEEDWTDGSVPYLRVEHVTEPTEEAMRKASEKGFAFASQPIFEYCEIETYRANMDKERLQHLYPHRTELDRGIRLCFSTDAPATSWAVPSDPFPNIKSAVTRRAYDGTDIGQSERVDIETAIILYTRNAAEVCGFSGLGQLAPGYSADFVVLSEDIFTAPADRIDQIRAEETFIRGECVYRR